MSLEQHPLSVKHPQTTLLKITRRGHQTRISTNDYRKSPKRTYYEITSFLVTRICKYRRALRRRDCQETDTSRPRSGRNPLRRLADAGRYPAGYALQHPPRVQDQRLLLG